MHLVCLCVCFKILTAGEHKFWKYVFCLSAQVLMGSIVSIIFALQNHIEHLLCLVLCRRPLP